MWSRLAIGLAGLLAASSTATAAERLVMQPYPGGAWYDALNDKNNGTLIREQLPQGQTLDNFTDVLTAQTVPDFKGEPATFLQSTLNELGQNCETVEMVGPTTGEEQGRQVAYGRVYCGRQKGETFGIHYFFKAILGGDALYLVGRGFRTPASDKPGAPSFTDENQAIAFVQAEGTATKYLTDHVFVCDPVFPDPKCEAASVLTAPGGR
jgi:hypothetical protein